MDLYLFRHAKAEIMAPGGGGDEARPLNPKGRELFGHAAKLWAALRPAPQLILTSPLLRARETGEILMDAWKQRGETPRLELEPGITPNAYPQQFLDSLPELDSLAIVSHMPFIGVLAGELLSGSSQELWFKTGTGMLIEYEPFAHSAKLLLAFGTKEAKAGLSRLDPHTGR
ncbi:MAG: hypothetical protein CSA62_09600 [Planctomycetota bacterium]|nr:MAG: hypothetical protein CSA62_09600 [Planctomycetota bacterium]